MSISRIGSRAGLAGVGTALAAVALVGATAVTAVAAVPAATTPVPAGATRVDDSTCENNPRLQYCQTTAAYVMATGTVAAQAKWLPGLKSWGLKVASNTCTSRPALASTMCVVRGSRSAKAVTVVFKAQYAAKYSPTAVKSQVDAIQKKATLDAKRAKSATARTAILRAATAKVSALKAAAASYNAAHAKTVVTVSVSK